MIIGIEGIMIGSQNAKKLAAFYKSIVGLKQTAEYDMDDNQQEFEFSLKGVSLYILDHKSVKDKNTQVSRILFNLEVDNIEKEVARLKKKGMKVIQDLHHLSDFGYAATFTDVDGNYFQFVKTRP